jgi:GTP1/Obg family GTP-binding protein
LAKKKYSVLVRQNKLSKGVSKLQEAKKVVHQLKTEAVRLCFRML